MYGCSYSTVSRSQITSSLNEKGLVTFNLDWLVWKYDCSARAIGYTVNIENTQILLPILCKQIARYGIGVGDCGVGQ